MIAASPELKKQLKARMATPKLLWFALTASIAIYVGVAVILAQGKSPVDIPAGLFDVLVVASAAIAMTSLAAPRLLLSNDRIARALESEFDPKAAAQPGKSGPVDLERQRKIEALPPVERRLMGIPDLLSRTMLIQLVLNECIAIFGLVLSILSQTAVAILPFAVVAFVLNLMVRPRLEPILARALRLVH